MTAPADSPFKLYSVPIEDIIQDSTFQVRAALAPAYIKRYADAYRVGAKIKPIQLAQIGGSLYLLDGWHRLAALRQVGETTVEAEVATMDREAAQWCAAQANLANGLPLKRAEYRNVFRAYIRAKQHRHSPHRLKSYREIAKEIGLVPHTTIRNWMRAEFPKLAARMGGGEGGNPYAGPPSRNPGSIRLASIHENLGQAAANYYALTDPGARSEAIQAFKATLASMEQQPHREARMEEIQMEDLSAF